MTDALQAEVGWGDVSVFQWCSGVVIHQATDGSSSSPVIVRETVGQNGGFELGVSTQMRQVFVVKKIVGAATPFGPFERGAFRQVFSSAESFPWKVAKDSGEPGQQQVHREQDHQFLIATLQFPVTTL